MNPLTFSSNPLQTYVGSTLDGNLHGPGFYTYEGERRLFYDGLFYLNELEGYGHVFYGDGSHFQGLFKENRRFGPGVLTHPDGTQDVGLWNGTSIIRLGNRIEEVEMPQLQRTSAGKAKMLKYRNLVPVCESPKDPAEETLRSYGASEQTLRRSHELYNRNVRSRHSLFFDKRLYDGAFFCNQNCTIELPEGDCEAPETEDTAEERSRWQEMHDRRIGQIEGYLEVVDETLEVLRRRKEAVGRRLDRCRECCCVEPVEREPVEPEERFGYDEVKIGEMDEEYVPLIDDVIEIKAPTKESASILTLDLYTPYDPQPTHLFAMSDDDESLEEQLLTPTYEYLERIPCPCVEDGDSSVNIAVLQQQMEELSKEEHFHSTIRTFLAMKMEKHSEARKEMTWKNTRKVTVQHLIAWNNEEVIVEMLKHSFLHRESEYMVTFTVADILTGKRQNFQRFGSHEQACKDFLVKCYEGNLTAVTKYLTECNVDVNVTDSRGNSAVFFAMMGDRYDLLKTLAQFGADLDQVNDESLSVLNAGILRYLSLRYDQGDWEQSFLPPDQPMNEGRCKWYSTSVHSQRGSTVGGDYTRRTIKDATGGYNRSRKEKQSIVVSNPTLQPYVSPYFFDPVPKQDVATDPDSVAEKLRTLGDLEDVLMELLHLGVDPNATEAPLPAFAMALFTENSNLVMKLVGNGAKTDVAISEGKLNCLHVIASLRCCEENVDICWVLTRDRRCDANATADPDHLPMAAKWLMGATSESQDFADAGMNPLHLLCLRNDFTNKNSFFFVKLAKLLIKGGCEPDDTYLGHTPLSIASLRGNLKLVHELLMCEEVDVYQELGDDMGNVLTVHGSKKYDDTLTIPQSKDTLDFLVAEGVNPLKPVGTCENAVDFLKVAEQTQPKPRRPTRHSSNSAFVMEYLTHLSRKVLVNFVEMEAVRCLYNVMEADMDHEENLKVLAQYLTPSRALRNLIALFESGRLAQDRFHYDLCIKVLRYVEANQIEDTKTTRKQKLNELDLAQLDDIDFFRYEVERNLSPDLSESCKHKVCFTCLLSKGKNLVVCSICEHFYFCSYQCYEISVREKTGHICRSFRPNFDNQEGVRGIRGGIKDLCELAERVSRSKRDERIARMMSEISKREKEERRMDVYGTKAIKTKQIFAKLMKTSTLATLRSSVDRRVSIKIKKKEVPLPFTKELKVLEQKLLAMCPKREEIPKISRRTCPKLKGNDALNSKTKKELEDLPISSDVKIKVIEKRYVRSVKSKEFPERARHYLQLLSTYFTESDFSDVLLPYACYADGNLYYNFRGGNYFCKSYSHV